MDEEIVIEQEFIEQVKAEMAKDKDAFVAAHADRKNAIAEKEPAKKN